MLRHLRVVGGNTRAELGLGTGMRDNTRVGLITGRAAWVPFGIAAWGPRIAWKRCVGMARGYGAPRGRRVEMARGYGAPRGRRVEMARVFGAPRGRRVEMARVFGAPRGRRVETVPVCRSITTITAIKLLQDEYNPTSSYHNRQSTCSTWPDPKSKEHNRLRARKTSVNHGQNKNVAPNETTTCNRFNILSHSEENNVKLDAVIDGSNELIPHRQ